MGIMHSLVHTIDGTFSPDSCSVAALAPGVGHTAGSKKQWCTADLNGVLKDEVILEHSQGFMLLDRGLRLFQLKGVVWP